MGRTMGESNQMSEPIQWTGAAYMAAMKADLESFVDRWCPRCQHTMGHKLINDNWVCNPCLVQARRDAEDTALFGCTLATYLSRPPAVLVKTLPPAPVEVRLTDEEIIEQIESAARERDQQKAIENLGSEQRPHPFVRLTFNQTQPNALGPEPALLMTPAVEVHPTYWWDRTGDEKPRVYRVRIADATYSKVTELEFTDYDCDSYQVRESEEPEWAYREAAGIDAHTLIQCLAVSGTIEQGAPDGGFDE